MKRATGHKGRKLHITFEATKGGYGHIVGTIECPDHHEDHGPYCEQCKALNGVRLTCQIGSGMMGEMDRERKPYAFRMETRDWSVNSGEVIQLGKAFAAIEKRVAKEQEQMGWTEDFAVWMARYALAAGVETVTTMPPKDSAFYPEKHNWAVADIGSVVREMLGKITAIMYPETAVA